MDLERLFLNYNSLYLLKSVMCGSVFQDGSKIIGDFRVSLFNFLAN